MLQATQSSLALPGTPGNVSKAGQADHATPLQGRPDDVAGHPSAHPKGGLTGHVDTNSLSLSPARSDMPPPPYYKFRQKGHRRGPLSWNYSSPGMHVNKCSIYPVSNYQVRCNCPDIFLDCAFARPQFRSRRILISSHLFPCRL